MIEIPAPLIDRLKTRSAVLVAGLGCAELVRLPGWPELGERFAGWLEDEAARTHVRTLMTAGRWAAAFAAMRARLPEEVIVEVLKDAYPPQTEVPKSFARMGRIPWRGMITTAFDDLWDRVAEADKRQPARIFLPGDAGELEQHRGRFLLRLFGSLKVPTSVCLAPSDLRRQDSYGSLVSFFGALAQKRCLVFVGFRPGDPDLAFVAQRLMGAAADPADHFLLYPDEPAVDAEAAGAELGLTAVPCSGGVAQIFRALGDAWEKVESNAEPAADDLDGWLESLGRDPADEEARAALSRLEKKLREGGSWARVVESLLGRIEHSRDVSEQVVALNEVGRIYAEELDMDDHAIASFQHVLSLRSRDDAALAALAKLFTKHERWDELAPVLEALSAAETDRARKVELLLQLANVLESRLGDEDATLACFERIAELAPTSQPALEGRERHYRKQQRWQDLARVLDQKAKLAADPAEAAAIRKERAELAERIGDVAASVTTLEAMVANDPNNGAALRSLEALYQKLGRASDSLRVLDRLCDVAESDAERLQFLRRLASGWEGQPDGLDRAADAWKQVLQIQPADRDAFAALRRLYREAKRWSALAETLARQLGARTADDREERLHLQVSLAKIYEEELGELPKAAAAYAAAEALGDERESTLEALARLAEQQGQWQVCVETLDRWAGIAKDASVRARLFHRAATILADKLDDRAAAEDRYAKALGADPTHVAALAALAALYQAQGEFLRAAKLMLEAEQHTHNRLEKARLLYQAATLHEDQLSDETRAIELYVKVMAVDPEHVQAARRLVSLYTTREAWARLEPVLEMLARKLDKGDVAVNAEMYGRLGLAAQKLGNRDKALRHYENAYRLAPGSLPVLAGFADLRMNRGEWREAVLLYEQILAQHRAALPEEEVVDVHMRLGQSEAGDGNSAAAIAWYEKTLAADPRHRGALEAIAGLHQEKEDWAALVVDKRRLLELVDDEDKVLLHEAIGDLYAGKLQKPSQAITAYQSALALAPNRRQVLHKALEHYTATRQWQEAASTLVRLADLEPTAPVRAKYAYTAAVICRDELADTDGAIELFNRALDDSPSLTKAFDGIERILTGARAWKELGRNYRRMIKRLPVEGLDELRLRLWNGLGQVSLEHLDDRDMAMTAMEVASSLEPGNARRHVQLADLYVEAGPDHYDKAITEHQLVIAENPERLASYRALGKLYGQIKAYDKVWCVAATLSFLRKAEPELQEFYEHHRPRDFRVAKRRFDDETWLKVVHPNEDRFVAAIFILLGHFVAAVAAQQHQAVGLKRKDRVDLTRDDRMVLRVLRYVSQTLDLPAPDVFFREEDTHGVSVVNLHEKGVLTPAFVMGPALAQRPNEYEVVFELGKRMAFLRPERFLRCAVPSPPALDMALRAAMALAGSPIGSGGHNGEVDRLTEQLRRLVPKAVAEQLAVVGKKLLSARGEVIDVEAWMAASDLTAARVGFVLTNDLPSAARVISNEPAGASPIPTKQRLKDLLSYSVSEEYFAVRKYLGLELM